MSVSSYALITLAEAKLYPGMASVPTADETIVEALIDAATLQIESYCRTALVQRAFIEDYSYSQIKAQDPSANTIWLRNSPIVSVSGIADQDSNTIDSDDYWLDKPKGALRTTGGWTIPQDANGFATYWTVTYTAGRWANTAAVPANRKLGCKMLVAKMYKRPNLDVSSKRVGDLSITYRDRGADDVGLPADVAAIFADIRKGFV